jgi:hypothetical protein
MILSEDAANDLRYHVPGSRVVPLITDLIVNIRCRTKCRDKQSHDAVALGGKNHFKLICVGGHLSSLVCGQA